MSCKSWLNTGTKKHAVNFLRYSSLNSLLKLYCNQNHFSNDFLSDGLIANLLNCSADVCADVYNIKFV